MHPENPEGTQVIVGSMNMGYDVYIRHRQEIPGSNSQPVPSQARADPPVDLHYNSVDELVNPAWKYKGGHFNHPGFFQLSREPGGISQKQLNNPIETSMSVVLKVEPLL